jgi:hypothetical protein
VVSLFRRKSDAVVDESVSSRDESVEVARARSSTPSKRELGKQTPKRPGANRRPGGAAAGPPLTKEEQREKRRQLRREASTEYRRQGGPRDRGPERALARDVIDARRTAGTFFFGGALLVLLGSNQAMPTTVQLVSNVLWVVLAVAVIVDGFLISRRIKTLVNQRFPNSTERMGSLYFYAIMRSFTFRRMRVPAPRVAIGDKI